jgi:hypothetical protein
MRTGKSLAVLFHLIGTEEFRPQWSFVGGVLSRRIACVEPVFKMSIMGGKIPAD